MTFEITYTRTFSTDDADPICQQDDDRVAEWFLGYPTHARLMAEDFGFTVERSK